MIRRTAPLVALGVCTALLLAGCAGEDPASIPDTETPGAEAVAASPEVVVTIGDSIMAGYGLDADEAWPALLAESTDLTVVNLGCSGAGFVAVGDCGTDFAGLIDDAIAADPDTIIVQSSDNDVFASEDDIATATGDTIPELHAALPDTRLIGLSTLWSLTEDTPDAIAWSTDALRAAIGEAGGSFVDIGQPFQVDPDLLQWDDEHPTAEGQRELLATILAELDAAGISL